MPGLIHLTVVLAGLVLPPTAAQEAPMTPAGDPEPAFELPRRDGPRRVVRELLGRNRTRSVNLTRYKMEIHDLDLSPDLADDPRALEDAADVLLSSFLRVTRERIERDLRLKERYDRLRGVQRKAGGRHRGQGRRPRVRFSPRAYLGDDGTLVGGKLRLRGLPSPLWSSAGLDVTHDLGGDNLRVRLNLDRPDWSSFFVYHSNRGGHGESAALGISRSF